MPTKYLQKKNILFIVAHSDDEALGMGGTIDKHVKNGDKVYGVYMTNGISARSNSTSRKIKNRKDAAILSSKILGFKWLEPGNFPDNAMDSVPILDVIKFIEKIKKKIFPSIVYTHNQSDLNIDHQIVSMATLTAFRPEPKEILEEIRSFEIPSSTDFNTAAKKNKIFSPNLYIDIQKNWPKKLKALKIYKDEMRSKPHSRSLEGLENLAKIRGNQSGLKKAEAFEVLRKIIR
ncbi:MAG: GlcNAc-PI de-N-acetylase [Candidatus Marinimicrobia bacterium]|nr:GlcNAc-PI de-N-acetylase [Candidatus Neomarinimicrobiota bacterium]|tara:strand:+ start:1738 stop:2436 length:699 start_codon:yes stop_codon:yes gene_type:complete